VETRMTRIRAKGHQERGGGVPGEDQDGTEKGERTPGAGLRIPGEGQDTDVDEEVPGLHSEVGVVEEGGDAPHHPLRVVVQDVQDLAVDRPGPVHLAALTKRFKILEGNRCKLLYNGQALDAGRSLGLGGSGEAVLLAGEENRLVLRASQLDDDVGGVDRTVGEHGAVGGAGADTIGLRNNCCQLGNGVNLVSIFGLGKDRFNNPVVRHLGGVLALRLGDAHDPDGEVPVGLLQAVDGVLEGLDLRLRAANICLTGGNPALQSINRLLNTSYFLGGADR